MPTKFELPQSAPATTSPASKTDKVTDQAEEDLDKSQTALESALGLEVKTPDEDEDVQQESESESESEDESESESEGEEDDEDEKE